MYNWRDKYWSLIIWEWLFFWRPLQSGWIPQRWCGYKLSHRGGTRLDIHQPPHLGGLQLGKANLIPWSTLKQRANMISPHIQVEGVSLQ